MSRLKSCLAGPIHSARRARAVAWLVLLCPLLVGCAAMPLAAGRKTVTLTVSAASDLTQAFADIGKAYEQQTGSRVVFNFGSTGQLAQQIAKGAPVDVFAAANLSYVDDLEKQGLVLPGSKEIYARGRITLWTPANSTLRIEHLTDLEDLRVRRVAIANPEHAPYGAAAREALQSAGLWDKLQSKLVFGENVSQALQYAQTGNVEVAIAPVSLSKQTDGHWTLIPAELHKPLDQAVGIIKGTQHEEEARAFVAFINGPQGRPIMRRYGFSLPGEEPAP